MLIQFIDNFMLALVTGQYDGPVGECACVCSSRHWTVTINYVYHLWVWPRYLACWFILKLSQIQR